MFRCHHYSNQVTTANIQVNITPESALLNKWFWNADSLRISYPDKRRFHDYDVITAIVIVKYIFSMKFKFKSAI